MKASEIRKMSPEQLNEKLAGLKKDLFYLRTKQNRMGHILNY